MKIALVGPVDLSRFGLEDTPEHYAFPLIGDIGQELRARGHHISAVTTSSNIAQPWTTRADFLDVTILPDTRRYRSKLWTRFKPELADLESAIRDTQPDVISAHWTYEFALAALRLDTPTLVTVHDWAPTILRHDPRTFRLVRVFMQRGVLRRATSIVANSPYIAQRVERLTGSSAPVIPNGIPFPSSLAERQIPSQPTVVALNMGFDKRKNVTSLLKAFAIVRRSCPEVRLRLGGAGYEVDGPCERWASERGLAHGVEFLGRLRVDDVPRFMREADVFVHPSLEESFGMVLVEAMREGTAVIAGESSGAVPWVVGGCPGARLLNVTDPELLARAIITCLDERADQAPSALARFTYARDRFSLPAIASRYEQALAAIASVT